MSLDARFELRIDGGQVMEIRVHPNAAPDSIADFLEDGAKDLRRKLENRNPLQYDPDTVSLTVPAMHVGAHLTNLLDSYNTKFGIALEMDDHEAANKYFSKGEKLFEWMHRNYTPQAIKNSPKLQQQLFRLESFKGIRQHNITNPEQ